MQTDIAKARSHINIVNIRNNDTLILSFNRRLDKQIPILPSIASFSNAQLKIARAKEYYPSHKKLIVCVFSLQVPCREGGLPIFWGRSDEMFRTYTTGSDWEADSRGRSRQFCWTYPIYAGDLHQKRRPISL